MPQGKITQEIALKVTGIDDLKKAEQAVEDIEGTKASATVEVEVEGERDLDKFVANLDGLTAERKTMVLALEAAGIENQLNDITAEIRELAGTDVDITAKIDGANQLQADLEKIEGTIKEINGLPVQPGGGRGIDDFDRSVKSAGSSASVLANTVGNTAQDIGQMAGLAGTAGVAIGQMGEYMADAALDGESLRTVLANFAKVLGPIAVITAAFGLFQQATGNIRKDAERTEKIISDLGAAFKETGDWTQAATKVLQDHSAEFENYASRITSVGEAIDSTILGKGLAQLPVIGDHFQQVSIDVEEALGRVGKGMDDVAETTEGNVIFNREFEQALLDGVKAGKLSEAEYAVLTDAIHSYQAEVKAAKDAQAELNLTAKTFHDTLEAIRFQGKPLEHFTDLWDDLFKAIKRGDDEAAAQLSNTLAGLLHIADPAQIVAIAVNELNRREQENSRILEENTRKQKENEEALRDRSIALDEARNSLRDLASTFSQMEIRSDAIRAAFDLGNTPLEALEATKNLEDGMRDLLTFIRDDLKGEIPDIFDPNDINAGPFLDKIASLRTDIQEKVAQAFATGGPEAADQMARAYIQQLVNTFGGAISAQEWENLIFPGGITADINIAVDQASLANAQKTLEILTGISGQTPWTASIQLAVAEGTLSPEAAQLLINQQLEGLGVDIPSSLEEVPDNQKTTVQREAADWLKQHPVNMLTSLDNVPGSGPGSKSAVRTDAQDYFDANGVQIPVTAWFQQPTNPPWWAPGGTVGGTIAPAAAGTAVVPGAAVAPAAAVQPIVVQPSVTVNASVIGNRYDVMRAVKRANLDKVRLLGERG